MALANATYTIRRAYKIPILHHNGKYIAVSEVTIVGASGDTYATAGITPVAASCGLKTISRIEGSVYPDSTHKISCGQAAWTDIGTDAKLQLFLSDDADTDDELSDSTSLENYTFVLRLEGYVS